jgi:hypothetical protein
MTALNLASIPVLENAATAGTLKYRDVLRGLRRAPQGLSVSALMTPDPDPIGSTADTKLPESAAGGPVGIEERAPALFEPDVLLPSQYFDRLRRSAEYGPERRLLVAVLEQGVNDYLKHAGAREPRELELWHEVEAWVEDRDASWLFSFENICHVLELEPDYLRRGLHTYKERARRGVREEPPTSAAPETRPERAGATSG